MQLTFMIVVPISSLLTKVEWTGFWFMNDTTVCKLPISQFQLRIFISIQPIHQVAINISYKPNRHFEYACVKSLSRLPFRDKQIYVDLNQEVIFI